MNWDQIKKMRDGLRSPVGRPVAPRHPVTGSPVAWAGLCRWNTGAEVRKARDLARKKGWCLHEQLATLPDYYGEEHWHLTYYQPLPCPKPEE